MQTIIATTTFILFAAAAVAIAVGIVAIAGFSRGSVETLRGDR